VNQSHYVKEVEEFHSSKNWVGCWWRTSFKGNNNITARVIDSTLSKGFMCIIMMMFVMGICM